MQRSRQPVLSRSWQRWLCRRGAPGADTTDLRGPVGWATYNGPSLPLSPSHNHVFVFLCASKWRPVSEGGRRGIHNGNRAQLKKLSQNNRAWAPVFYLFPRGLWTHWEQVCWPNQCALTLTRRPVPHTHSLIEQQIHLFSGIGIKTFKNKVFFKVEWIISSLCFLVELISVPSTAQLIEMKKVFLQTKVEKNKQTSCFVESIITVSHSHNVLEYTVKGSSSTSGGHK